MRAGWLLLAGCTAPGDSAPVAADTGLPAAPVAGVRVDLDPEVVTILRVRWTQEEAVDAGWIAYGVDGEEPRATPARALGAGDQAQVLLGLPASEAVTLRVIQERDGERLVGDEVRAATGDLPRDLLRPRLVHADPSLQDPTAPFWLGTVDAGGAYRGPCQAFVLDRLGRVVWYREVPGERLSLFAQVATDGTHVVLEGTTHYLYGTELLPIVERLTLAGGVFETLELADLGFAFDEIEGGALLYGSERDDGHRLVRRERDGTERVLWDAEAWLAAAGGDARESNPNSVVWNPAQGTAFWSMFLNDTVAEVDLASGDVVRYFGQLPGGWAFDPADSVVDYQHYPGYTPAGTLLASTHALGDPGVQYAREWRVDGGTETLTEVWSYGEEVVPYARYGGEAWRLPGGNTFITYGTAGQAREITPDGRTAWELAWPEDPDPHLLGHFTAIADLWALSGG